MKMRSVLYDVPRSASALGTTPQHDICYRYCSTYYSIQLLNRSEVNKCYCSGLWIIINHALPSRQQRIIPHQTIRFSRPRSDPPTPSNSNNLFSLLGLYPPGLCLSLTLSLSLSFPFFLKSCECLGVAYEKSD